MKHFNKKFSDSVFAIFLILIGLILLLNTTEIISWDIWKILFNFWPLIIIYIGFNIVLDNNKILKILFAIFSFITFFLIFFWSLNQIENIDLVDTDKSNYVVSHKDFENVKKKKIDIDMGVGNLEIDTGNSKEYIKLNSFTPEYWEEPEVKKTLKNNVLNLNLILGEKKNIFFFNTNPQPKYVLMLGDPKTPTDLTLSLGAGKSTINIEDYNLDNLTVDMGAGKVRISLKDFVKKDIDLNVGAGELIIEVPDDYSYTVNGSVGVGEVNIKGEKFSGLGKNIENFKSEKFNDEKSLNFIVNVGVGKLTIK